MPEFFFHISIELLATIQPPVEQSDNPVTSWPSGNQALSPFLSHRPPYVKRSIDSLKASRGTQSQLHGGLREVKDFSSNESQRRLRSSSRTIPDDKRLDHIFIESPNTSPQNSKKHEMNSENHISKGIGSSANGLQTKGRYEPLDQQVSDTAWGVVHLYRDADETPGLYGDSFLSQPSNPWYSRALKDNKDITHPPAADQDCTTLCILAVPSYMAPSDFLGFIGEETREQVSHFRMIRTARANRYMVLIRFRDGKTARKWQKAWNGKVFNSMEVMHSRKRSPTLTC